MGQLIDDLLTLSRVSRKELERRPVDLSQLAQVICEELHQQEPDRDVQIRIAPRLQVEGDPSLMRTVWKTCLAMPGSSLDGLNIQPSNSTSPAMGSGCLRDPRQRRRLRHALQRTCSGPSSVFIPTGSFPAPESAWPPLPASSADMGEVWAEGDVGKGASLYFSIGQPHPTEHSLSAPDYRNRTGRSESSFGLLCRAGKCFVNKAPTAGGIDRSLLILPRAERASMARQIPFHSV
jgi:hypothetical protein